MIVNHSRRRFAGAVSSLTGAAGVSAFVAVVGLAALAGCQQAIENEVTSGVDCLVGGDTSQPGCNTPDTSPDFCTELGGVYDYDASRCIR